jgi:hypothetical protein
MRSARVYEAVKGRQAILAYEQMDGLCEDRDPLLHYKVFGQGARWQDLVEGPRSPLTARMKSRVYDVTYM